MWKRHYTKNDHSKNTEVLKVIYWDKNC